METPEIINIENDSLGDFFRRYCKKPLDNSYWSLDGFSHRLDIIAGSFKEGTLVYFHINEYGSRTHLDIKTILVYRVVKYDFMCDRLVRVDKSDLCFTT
jgi:hypothetical protein